MASLPLGCDQDLDLLRKAEKFTPGQPTTVHIPHCVLLLLEQKYCISFIQGGWANPRSYYLTTQILKVVCTLNLDTLLPNMTELVHNFTQITEVYSSTPNPTYQPLENPKMEMFMDESSFMT